jgi:hypothetical protein
MWKIFTVVSSRNWCFRAWFLKNSIRIFGQIIPVLLLRDIWLVNHFREIKMLESLDKPSLNPYPLPHHVLPVANKDIISYLKVWLPARREKVSQFQPGKTRQWLDHRKIISFCWICEQYPSRQLFFPTGETTFLSYVLCPDIIVLHKL